MSTSTTSPSPFWRSVDLSHTALLLTDIQAQIFMHMPPNTQKAYLSTVKAVLDHFRTQIRSRRAEKAAHAVDPLVPNDGIPLIIHHLIPVGQNAHAFISPYNKINSTWATKHLAGIALPAGAANPETPWFAIPEPLRPTQGWIVDEVILGKTRVGSFSDSTLLGYLRARDVKHVVLCGLTTEGAVLSSVRGGADLDFHVIVVREGCWSGEEGVGEFVLERLVGRFADVVGVEDVLCLA
jgi:nicotinamidase-related amidase